MLNAAVFPITGYAELKVTNASQGGFGAETMAFLRPSDSVIFSVGGNRFHQGTVRWVRGRKFGADLDNALGILHASGELDPGLLLSHEPRPRRYAVELTGRMVLGALRCRAIVRDVSRSGLRLEVGTRLAAGQQILVQLPDRPLILASVRWQAEHMVGVETAERMQTLRLVYADK